MDTIYQRVGLAHTLESAALSTIEGLARDACPEDVVMVGV